MRLRKLKERFRTHKKRIISGLSAAAIAIAAVMIPSKTDVYAGEVIYKQATQYIQYIAGDSDSGVNFPYRMAFYGGTSLSTGGQPAYCLQPYASMVGFGWLDGSGSGWSTGQPVLGSVSFDAYNGMASSTKNRIQEIAYFGYGYGSRTDTLDYMATQEAIWDTVQPCTVYWDYRGTSHRGALNSEVDNRKNAILADVYKYENENAAPSTFQIKDPNGNVVGSSGSNALYDHAVVGQTYTVTDTSGYLASSTIVGNTLTASQVKFNGQSKSVGQTAGSNSFTVTIDDSMYNNTGILTVSRSSTVQSRGTSKFLTASGFQNMLVTGTVSGKSSNSTVTLSGVGVPIKIHKSGTDGSEINGAALQLYKNSGSGRSLIASWTSDGRAKDFTVCPGSYTLVETDTPNGYYKSSPLTFTVNSTLSSTPQEYTTTDKPISAYMDKISTREGDDPIAGAVMQLQTTEGSVLETWTTDGNRHKFDNSKLKAGNSYRIVEVSSPAGYYALTDPDYFQISEYDPGADEVESVGDYPIDYRVAKIDALTGEMIAGAEMQLYDSNGTVLDEWTSSADEAHNIKNTVLEVGKTYTIHETKAADGYYLSSEDKSFTVTQNYAGTFFTSNFQNNPVRYSVQKTDENGIAVVGAALQLKDADGTVIDEWVSDGTGHEVDHLIDGATYTIEETKAPNGYYRSSTTFTVGSKNQKDQEGIQQVTLQEPEIEFYVAKRDENGVLMAGAEIQLMGADRNVLTTITSASDGAVRIPKEYLAEGQSYILHESKPVDGYYSAQSDINFTVPSSYEDAKKLKNSELTIKITDPSIRFEVEKIDADSMNSVAGATLGIYDADDPEQLLYSWETTDEPFRISDQVVMKTGQKFIIRELQTPDGYFTNESGVEFEVPQYADNVITVDFTNVPIKWQIKKVDANDQLLTTVGDSSFKLEVYDTNETQDTTDDDDLITTLDTADNDYQLAGYFDMDEWIKGGFIVSDHTYRIHEAEAANGYMTADDVYVTIVSDGTVNSTLLTSVKDAIFEVRLKKTDENGNVLTTYETLGGAKKGFVIGIYDASDNSLAATIDTSNAEYVKNGYVTISDKLSTTKDYVAKEIETPFGYYKAKDVEFNLDSLGVDESKPGEITMVDPTIRVRFRKEDKYSNVLTESDGEGFEYQVIDDETNEVVGTFNTKDDSDDIGWINIGSKVQEGRTYRIHEIYAPSKYKYSTEDVKITVPGYYNESAGSVTNVVIGTDTPARQWQGEDYLNPGEHVDDSVNNSATSNRA